MYKIIFIDIDGTLRNNNKVITERVKKSIVNIRTLGIEVVLCTGRPRGRTIDFSKESSSGRYIISSGGSEVYDIEEDRVIYENTIPNKIVVKLIGIIEKYKLIYYINSGGIRAVNHKIRLYGNEITVDDINDFIEKNKVHQIVLNSDNIETMRRVETEINTIEGLKIPNHSKCLDNPDLMASTLMYCDVVKEDTDKGTAIRNLCQYLNIKKEETIGIGDNKNDISMFNEVSLKVAMDNGIKELKDTADIVTETNSNDGVAVFLEDLYIKMKGN